MPINPAKYLALFVTYDKVTDELITQASILPVNADDGVLRGKQVAIKALWDTGATVTCIKPALRERLKLRPLESVRAKLAGMGSRAAPADAAMINLLLTSELVIECCPVYVADFPGDADMLIGMDIIGKGDFAVCNFGGKTSFSFAVPPFPDRVNFADRAEAANRGNAV